MDDVALVLAARSGDTDALAAIYDRYGDRLHDYCWSILRDHDEAADTFHDTFLAASQRLDQLRDPAKLRPWLYAIARHESLRRAKARRRQEPTDEMDDVTAGGPDVDEPVRQEEAARLVWAAAAGLADRDRALLDLNLRQGLEGQELADAIGVEPAHAYVLLSRLRDQVERSLGALLVARYGRRDCPELERILEGWDGRFSPLIRKRVARHTDGCQRCSDRRGAMASPTALLGAMPLLPAPAELRDRILGDIRRIAASSRPDPRSRWAADKEGFPPPAYPRSRSPRPAFVAAAVVLLALLLGALLGPFGGGSDVEVVAAAGGATTTAPAGGDVLPPDTTVPSDGAAPGGDSPAGIEAPALPPLPLAPLPEGGPDTTLPPGTGTTGPRLRLGTETIDFGATSTAEALEIANDGDAPLTWTATASGPFSVTPAEGNVPAGGTTRATVRLDRAGATEGAMRATLPVTSDGGSGSVALTARVTHPPVVGGPAIDNPRLARSPCSVRPTSGAVSATITDDSGLASAVLRWQDPSGVSGSRDLVPGGGGAYRGTLGPFTSTGGVTWWIEAVDTLGAEARSADQAATVDACR